VNQQEFKEKKEKKLSEDVSELLQSMDSKTEEIDAQDSRLRNIRDRIYDLDDEQKMESLEKDKEEILEEKERKEEEFSRLSKRYHEKEHLLNTLKEDGVKAYIERVNNESDLNIESDKAKKNGKIKMD